MQSTSSRLHASSDASTLDTELPSGPVLALPPGRASLSVTDSGREGPLLALPPGKKSVARIATRIVKLRA